MSYFIFWDPCCAQYTPGINQFAFGMQYWPVNNVCSALDKAQYRMIADVELLPDSKCWEEPGRVLKTNKLLVSAIRSKEKVFEGKDTQYIADICCRFPYDAGLRYVDNITEELYIAIASRNGFILNYIDNQTEEICAAAVENDWSCLRFVADQTERLCMKAVRKHWKALEYIHNQTKEMCIEALRQDEFALQYVKEQTEEMCLDAVKRNWEVLEYVKNKTENICIAAVEQNYRAIFLVPRVTNAIYFAAAPDDRM